jgi:hypothetical protein
VFVLIRPVSAAVPMDNYWSMGLLTVTPSGTRFRENANSALAGVQASRGEPGGGFVRVNLRQFASIIAGGPAPLIATALFAAYLAVAVGIVYFVAAQPCSAGQA